MKTRFVMRSDGATAIELRRGGGLVTFVPYELHGLRIERMPIAAFEKLWRTVNAKAATYAILYVNAATQIGATSEAVDALATIVEVPDIIRMRIEAQQIARSEASKPRKKKPKKEKRK